MKHYIYLVKHTSCVFRLFTRLSADSPFQEEQDRNIKKGKIQFGCCYPGLSEGALNFMKSSLNNKSWYVWLVLANL